MPSVTWSRGVVITLLIVAILLVVALIATSEPRERETGNSVSDRVTVYLGKVPKLERTITSNGNPNIWCFNGVQYWQFHGTSMGSSATATMAPKYSPGHTWPDKCDGTEKRKFRLVKE